MPSVSREIAMRELERVRKQKRPKMYCIARYDNVFTGGDGYKLCYRKAHYDEMLTSPAVGRVEVLWASERCKKDAGNGNRLA